MFTTRHQLLMRSIQYDADARELAFNLLTTADITPNQARNIFLDHYNDLEFIFEECYNEVLEAVNDLVQTHD